MSTPVNTVASGGLAVVDVTNASVVLKRMGKPITEAAAGQGVAVTVVTTLGLPVIYTTIPPSP